MADFGTKGADYKPDLVYSGLIGKIALQAVEGMDTPDKFDEFNKQEVNNGKDVEITLYENATGQDYNPNGINVIPDPVSHTLYFTKYDEKSYPVKINNWDIKKAAKDNEYAEKTAGVIIETLYGGDREHVREMNYAQFNAAVAGTPNADGSIQIVSVGSAPEVTNEETARAVLAAIKLSASGMREEPAAFNPYGLPKYPDRIGLIIPYQTRVKIELYLLAGTKNLNYADYGVDFVIDVPASETDGAIFLVDDRYVQNRIRKQVYEEERIFGSGGNVKAALSTSRMYALCPLFCAVKIPQGAAAETAEAAYEAYAASLDKNTAAAAKIANARAKAAAAATKEK